MLKAALRQVELVPLVCLPQDVNHLERDRQAYLVRDAIVLRAHPRMTQYLHDRYGSLNASRYQRIPMDASTHPSMGRYLDASIPRSVEAFTPMRRYLDAAALTRQGTDAL